jgi:hypothetical protein
MTPPCSVGAVHLIVICVFEADTLTGVLGDVGTVAARILTDWDGSELP